MKALSLGLVKGGYIDSVLYSMYSFVHINPHMVVAHVLVIEFNP